MDRLTRKTGKEGRYAAECKYRTDFSSGCMQPEGTAAGGNGSDVDTCSCEVINKLAKFENICDDLMAEQERIADELEKLKLEKKTGTARFKQLLANKMINGKTLILFKSYGIFI